MLQFNERIWLDFRGSDTNNGVDFLGSDTNCGQCIFTDSLIFNTQSMLKVISHLVNAEGHIRVKESQQIYHKSEKVENI